MLDRLDVATEPEAWRALGFAVDHDGSVRAGTVRIQLGVTGRRVASWSLRGLDEDVDIDGLCTLVASGSPSRASPLLTQHPNGMVAIDHVVVMTPDPERTTKALGAHGLEVRRRRTTDTYGAPMTQTFFRVGEPILELIGPERPPPDAVDQPARFYGIAFTVADLAATADYLGPRLGRVKDAVQPGRRIATLRRDAGAGLPLAFMSPGRDALGAAGEPLEA